MTRKSWLQLLIKLVVILTLAFATSYSNWNKEHHASVQNSSSESLTHYQKRQEENNTTPAVHNKHTGRQELPRVFLATCEGKHEGDNVTFEVQKERAKPLGTCEIIEDQLVAFATGYAYERSLLPTAVSI